MEQKLNCPNNESELRKFLDCLYERAKEGKNSGSIPKFKGLLEVISSEPVIVTAVHNIKANKGSNTKGSDNMVMQEDILEKEYDEIIKRVKGSFINYKPMPVRRVYIPKPGKAEKRPLGIPSILDRIIQECIRIVLEPILEAQFFNHSYGFRPMRDAHMVVERLEDTIHNTGYKWVLEGDISKFFDNVNHTILIKRLCHMGIQDRRVLMIIKEMLKAGIMNETTRSELGTPQGGILSPLLANVYLDTFDQWVAREWENKKTKREYSHRHHKLRALRLSSNLKPAYLIRYADDWVLITDSKEHAEVWKYRIAKFFKDTLKLELSQEKTLITKVTKKPVKFLGFEIKRVKGKNNKYVSKIYANRDRLDEKLKSLHKEIKRLRHIPKKEYLVYAILNINSKIRGLIQYYQNATAINIQMSEYHKVISYAQYKALKRQGAHPKWIRADESTNLTSVHGEYKTKIPTIMYNGMKIGFTSIIFCRWTPSSMKNQDETPYTETGREMYKKRTSKKPLQVRADELFNAERVLLSFSENQRKEYNFEYVMNRPYAFNRDKGKCRICKDELNKNNVHIHHKNPKLPLGLLNKLVNLVSTCTECHKRVHNKEDYSYLGKIYWNKLIKYRNELGYN